MRRLHPRARTLGAAVGVAAVVASAAVSVAATAAEPTLSDTGTVEVDGGSLTVDAVVSAAPARHSMPGMGTDDDPVADGERRVSVDVTLRAGGGVLEYDVDEFSLLLPGTAPAREVHKAVLPGGALPAGSQLSGTLVFDVPADATAGTLLLGDEAGVAVALPAQSAGADGRGEAGHGGEHEG